MIFNPVPDPKTQSYLPLGILFGVLILAAVAIAIFAKRDMRKMLKPYITPFSITGTLGLIHLGSRYEMLPWLASRFTLILILTVFVAWMLGLAVWMSKFVPEFKAKKITEDKYNKYLPKRKEKE